MKGDRNDKMDGKMAEENSGIWIVLLDLIVVLVFELLSLDDFFRVTVSMCFFT